MAPSPSPLVLNINCRFDVQAAGKSEQWINVIWASDPAHHNLTVALIIR
jgi:hypothetical protein